jgi:uncharacterized repeat protein (TIGR01451 family)
VNKISLEIATIRERRNCMKKVSWILMALVVMFALVGTVSAWGTSAKIAAVDDQGGSYTGQVCSSQMGCVNFANIASAGMSGTMTRVQPADVNAATLGTYDTLFLFNTNPSVLSASQKSDIVDFVKAGGKLVIWDSEDQYYQCGGTGCWKYDWLPTPFSLSVPGAQGATGALTDVEENDLSSLIVGNPHYIDTNYLSQSTDAVGDANVFTSFVASQWCTDMTAKNYLQVTGPVHVYTKGPSTAVGKGIIIFSGLDWDYNGIWLHKMLAYEFNVASLPCGVPPPQYFTVTKVADKAKYNVGDPMTFDVSIMNNGQYTATGTVAVDLPPSEITCAQTNIPVGNLAPGASWTGKVTCTADEPACGVTNSLVATGYYSGQPIFTGSATSAAFDIGPCGTPAPEFPTLALPVGMILGFVFIVYSMRGTRKE